jgi:hypothetical protein
MTDVRREATHILKNYHRYQREAGETLVWFQFKPLGTDAATSSVYDDVYDEGPASTGGLKYETGVILPLIQMQEAEDNKRSNADGRLPLQTVNGVMAVQDLMDAGITNVSEYREHLNDMFYYDGRYYSVNAYRVRGRARGDVLITFEGIERYLDQEFAFDPGPTDIGINDYPWPSALPL